MPKQDEKKCLLCNQEIADRFWSYLWRQNRGFCCDGCGHAIHDAGYKILNSIADILEEKGCEIQSNKEKFGFYRLDVIVDTPEQKQLAEALFNQATKDFPEFSFDFSAWLRHDTSLNK